MLELTEEQLMFSRCMTVDIISQLAFGSELGLTEESSDSFDARFLGAFDVAASAVYGMYFSPLQKLAGAVVPLRLVAKLDETLAKILDLQDVAKELFLSYKARSGEISASNDVHPVMFDTLKGIPDNLQISESIDILIAGSDTTAFTLAVALDAILRDSELYARMTKAVDMAMPDKNSMPPFTDLERNPMLFAVVKESLRLAMPVPGVLPRKVPHNGQPLIVDDVVVPPGTVVGISAYTMHTSTRLWGDDAKHFNPDRWLNDDSRTLDSAFATFSKGQRQCIGIKQVHDNRWRRRESTDQT